MFLQALTAVLVFIFLAVAGSHLVQEKPSGGSAPNVAAETYLYYDPASPSPSPARAAAIASGYQGKVSTPGDLSFYSSLGGSAGWCGITSTGEVYSVPGARYSPDAPVTPRPCCGPHGVWITGPKIVAGERNVSPFNCESWYQPAGS